MAAYPYKISLFPTIRIGNTVLGFKKKTTQKGAINKNVKSLPLTIQRSRPLSFNLLE
jgi:hypothetical protein